MQPRIAHRSRPCAGETANGDRAITRELGADSVLLAVIDALGHGPHAAHAAQLAADVLEREPIEGGVVATLGRLDRALRGSRGAAVTLAIVRGTRVEIVGVGNVDLRIVGATSAQLVGSPGVVGGAPRRAARPLDLELTTPARIVLWSDGISRRFRLDELEGYDPDAACAHVLERYSVAHDDATVLVADFGAGARHRRSDL